MLPRNVWRTTTFRLATVLAAIFTVGIGLLLGLVYVRTAGYMSARANHILTAEFRQVGSTSSGEIVSVLKEAAARDPLTGFGLFDAKGNRLAGDGTLLPGDLPLDGEPHDFPERLGSSPQRGLGKRLPWGDVLIIQRDTRQLTELREIIVSALVWSGVSIAVLGLVLAIGFSIRPLARVKAMRDASDAIVDGNLAIRLPVEGKGDELDELAKIVNGMMDEIERLMTEARTVGEGVAHELRTPLTRLRAMLDHASQDIGVTDPRGQLMERCIAEADGVLARFRGLLRIAAVETRSRTSGIGRASLTNIVAQIGELYSPLAIDRGVNLDVHLEEGVEIRADPELLFEALSNLVDNALKFTLSGGNVRMSLIATASGATIEVRDDGIGIPPAERSLVTKRFYRSQAVSKVPGYGLGLSLVAAVARLHGFELSIEDGQPGTMVRLFCNARPILAVDDPTSRARSTI